MFDLLARPWVLIPVCALLGLLIGSFLNVVIYRLPVILKRAWARDASEFLSDAQIHEELAVPAAARADLIASAKQVENAVAALPHLGLATPRSRCGACGHQITALENIPVLSYLVLRGRCSSCNAHISLRYPIIELLVGLLFAAAAWQFSLSIHLGCALVIISILTALTMIDADTMLLPDSLTLSLLWLGLVAAALNLGFVPLWDSVIGAAVGYSVFWLLATGFKLLRGVEGMGAGDFKLLAALGAWFGWTALLPIVLLSAGVGSVVGVSLMLSGRATMLSRLPFGVYLAPAGLIMLFYGPELISLVMPGAS